MKDILTMKWSNGEKFLVLFALFLFSWQFLLSNSLSAHIGIAIQPATFLAFLSQGFQQFTFTGANHVLFLAAFFLICPKTDEIIRQSFIFSVGFLFSEFLVSQGFLEPNTYILNSLLLISIFFIGVENIFSRKLKIESSRFLFLAIFGLVHGAAFGNHLVNNTASAQAPFLSLISYSLGLMLGEIFVLALLFIFIGKFLAVKPYYKKAVVTPLSISLAAYSVYNMVQLLLVTN